MARAASTVHVHREDGSEVVYLAGVDIPAKDAKLITNPKVWADDESPSDADAGTSSADDAKAAEAKAKADADAAQKAADAAAAGSGPLKPPVVGAGSGQAPWSDYAKALGLTVADDANKASIIELVTEHEKQQGA